MSQVQQVIPPPPPVCNGFYYTVQPGDSLFSIAQRFGVSLQALIAANPQITNPNLIFPGQIICVPTGRPPIQNVRCSMLLYRTANVPILPDAEAGGVARISQNNNEGNVLISTIGLPPPRSLGGNIYVAWIRRTGMAPIPVQLLQTSPVTEPGVWTGAFIYDPTERIVPFHDIVVTAEIAFPVTVPNLNRIALFGLFSECCS